MTEYVTTYKSAASDGDPETYASSVAVSVTAEAGDHLLAEMFTIADATSMNETCSGGGLTWTSAGSSVDPGNLGSRLGVWTTQATSAGTFTVTVSGSTTTRGLYVYRFSGSAGIGVSANGSLNFPSLGIEPSLAVPGVSAGSTLLSFNVYESGDPGARTYRSVDGAVIEELDHYSRTNGYYSVCNGMATTVTSGTKTVGLTSPASDYQGVRMVAVELLAGGDPDPEPEPVQTVTEDFEDDTYTIAFTGDWVRTTTDAHSGTGSLKAATIGHNAESSITVTVPAGAETMQFWWKVSSESGYDFFALDVGDDEEIFARSGAQGWLQSIVYDVSAASTVKFRYYKDQAVSGNQDTAWIDDLVFTVTGAAALPEPGRFLLVC